MSSVLIVDDLLSIQEMLEAVIQPSGFSTAFASDGDKALSRYKAEKFDLVLADIDMKPMDGITLLRQLREYDPQAVVIIMTAYASTESAIQALKFGAFDYLQKPFRVDELLQTLKRAYEYKQFTQERANVAVPSAQDFDIETRLPGQSPKMRKLHQQVRKLASARAPVLLIGESGTGKKTVAEILHAAAEAPEIAFVAIDCAHSSEENIRGGLLGENGEGGTWVKQARGGTLHLCNLHQFPSDLQGELVSVLRNAGPSFRLICSTSEDLEKLTDEGKFNEELFYRVATLPVHLPPLRDRVEDLPTLVKDIASRTTNPLFETHLIEFTEDAMTTMAAYRWPGNLTELNQVVSKIASTSDVRVITSQQLPLRLHDLKDWPNLGDYLAGQEKQYMSMVLHACRGNKKRAADILGIDIKKFG